MEEDAVLGYIDSYFGSRLWRYDVQYILEGLSSYLVEETYVLAVENLDAFAVALPARPATLQINMKATDGHGNKLVILSRREEAELLWGLLKMARAFLVRCQPPPCVERLLEGEEWPLDLRGQLSPQDTSEVETYGERLGLELERLFSDGNEAITEAHMAAFIVGEMLASIIGRDYVPWVFLPAQTTSPKFNRLIIKYVAHERVVRPPTVSAARFYLGAIFNRLALTFLGTFEYAFKVPTVVSVSSHARVRPPAGMAIDRPIEMPPNALADADRGQIQAYVRADHAKGERVGLRARFTQTASTRLLLAAFFLGVAFLPAALVWARWKAGFVVLGSDASFFWELVREISASDIVSSSSILLPLALALVASVWERPTTRSFVVTQILLGMLGLGLWLFAPHFQTIAKICLVCPVFFLIYNLMETLPLAWPLSSAR